MKKFTLVILALILSACSLMPASEFNQNLAKWHQADLSHYQYDLVIGCFCPFSQDMPLTIEVKDEVVVSITRADGTLIDSSNMNYQYYVPYAILDGLFAELKTEMTEADEITVTYDPLYGFPVNVAIDRIKLAMDDELSLQVINFEVLK